MKILILGFCIILSILAFAGDIDTKKSFIKWHATKVGGEHWGHIKFKEGKIQTNDKGEPVKASFVVDMASIDVRDLSGEWKDKLQNHLRTGDFFEISKYPTATMTTTDIKKAGENKYKVKGNFKIKNKSKEMSFDMTYDKKVASGKFSFNRTNFNVMYGSSIIGTVADKVIHDKVNLEFKVY